MNNLLKNFLILLVPLLLITTNSIASNFGTNITIFDGMTSGGTGVGSEDNEVEPSNVANQFWDLEGFFLSGTKLTMIGGYDFVNGKYGSGDIFIDVDGDVKYGPTNSSSGSGNQEVSDTFGYDYVLDLEFGQEISDHKYNVYSLDNSSTLTVWYVQNNGSNPWRYSGGGTPVSGNNQIIYQTGLTDTGFSSWGSSEDVHNAVIVDIGFLANLGFNGKFTAHFTMGCGNDNLMGRGPIPNPEPTTMLLFGFGLLGLAGVCRKK